MKEKVLNTLFILLVLLLVGWIWVGHADRFWGDDKFQFTEEEVELHNSFSYLLPDEYLK